MHTLHSKLAAGAALLLLAGCATPPPGPTIPAMPGQGKSFAQFQQDDGACQQFASDRVAGRVNDVNNRAAATTIVGTALGAGLGAAIGNGRGAAIGAASGAVVGGSVAANDTAYGEHGIQRQYNIAYAQCMTAHGNQVGGPRGPRRGYGHPPPPPPGYGPPPPPPPGY
jgi:hypothetical protein